MSSVQRTPPNMTKTRANNKLNQTQTQPEANSATPSNECVKSNRSKRLRHENSPQNVTDSTTELLRDQLATWKTDQDNSISKILAEQTNLISKLLSEITEIKTQNIQIQASNADIHKSNEEIVQSVSFINNKFEDMKKEIEKLRKERLEQQLHIENLEKKVIDLQQKSRSIY